jgi:hypothetical protein
LPHTAETMSLSRTRLLCASKRRPAHLQGTSPWRFGLCKEPTMNLSSRYSW